MVEVRDLAWCLAVVRRETSEEQGTNDEQQGSDWTSYSSKDRLVGEHGVCKSLCVGSLSHGFAHNSAPVE